MKKTVSSIFFLTALLAGLAWVLVPAAWARTLYIGEKLETYLRKGPSTEFRITGRVRVGQSMEAMEQENGWTRVTLPSGKEGWVLSRFLTPQEPAGRRVDRLEKENRELSETTVALTRENQRLATQNQELSQKLGQESGRASQLEADFNQLKKESESFFRVKKSLEQSQKDLAENTRKLEFAQIELDRLTRSRLIRWFLAGAGVLLFGLVIGLAVRPKKRRSSIF